MPGTVLGAGDKAGVTRPPSQRDGPCVECDDREVHMDVLDLGALPQTAGLGQGFEGRDV